MTQVATRAAGGAVAALQGLGKSLRKYVQAIPKSGGDPYLKMGKDGNWSFGQENIEVDDTDVWAVNPHSFKHGYTCWTRYPEGDNRPNSKLGEVMVSATQDKPPMETLPKHDYPWADCCSFQLQCVEGENKGEQSLYNNSSKGGLDFVGKLVEAVADQIDTDPTHPVALVQLSSGWYPHPKYGKTYTPEFTIVGWASIDDMNDQVDVGEPAPVKEPEPAPAPAKRTRKAPSAKASQPVEAEPRHLAAEPSQADEDEDEEAELLRKMEEIRARKAAAAAAPAAPADDGIRQRRTRRVA
jgi:hypothetical protein